ncbi:type II toxin-antitoxin system death-on-curing family toxin [Patescibacteria group bacterium]|nr:type II toxin-antitoxin system death-on-curing family toxin [Patescibacteria group bacterium]
MRYLSVEEILALHDYQIQRFGGSKGVLNLPLLESAANRPITNISGKDMYKSVHEKAAVLTYSITRNHPFVDGNKRTGLHAALTFLELNGYKVTISQKKLIKLGLDIADKKADLKKITSVFKKYSVRK